MTKFILGKCISRSSDPYWVTNVYGHNLETGEEGFLGDLTYNTEKEAVRAYNSLTHARDNKIVYRDLPDQLQLELRMCCIDDMIPGDTFVVTACEFHYCNKNGIYFDIVGVE